MHCRRVANCTRWTICLGILLCEGTKSSIRLLFSKFHLSLCSWEEVLWNYNYGQCGNAIGVGLLNNPDLAATDPVISFKTAIWFWMTPQSPKPSCHNVIIGKWSPTPADSAAGRVPGYGVITNIINGGIECGKGPNDQVKDRIGFYKRYCDILGVSYGSNLDCHNQRPFGNGLLNLVNSM
ncbi:hypothetical protein MANES_04G067520v8 [Manihot esculenta]|uniref:Uncharacterized protein n=1 Tax=Manihot esculenta TaxID=3983 RepID=A0ACB7HV10_MANES|nr:hypothetical protein MANES_04G067520v8 [Manihot esculenta]